ncbi:MAG TPA: helix-turn-helix transcriptional regulator [Pseudonocardiaceae bacterium]|jgi:DNA-binding NarL/FixJ family response regulator|nr:helix-turn-helix transcriptional regulator [Pseudonocardiaceae bacterium]
MTEPRMELDADEIELIRLFAKGVVRDAVARQLRVGVRTLRCRIRALCDRFGGVL